MKLSEILFYISERAKKYKLSTPYIVGGVPRDKLVNKPNNFEDIDITTGDAGIHFLSKDVATTLRPYISSYNMMPDGHSTMISNGIKFDFSSNFNIPHINEILAKIGIVNPSEMQKELYSRDFTCNAALLTMDIKRILDPTGMSVPDIKNKVIRTCLPPILSLGYDNRRIFRLPYMSAKLDFNIDPEIITWIKNNKKYAQNVSPKYMVRKISKAFKYNPKRVVDFLDAADLWDSIPIMKQLIPYLAKRIV